MKTVIKIIGLLAISFCFFTPKASAYDNQGILNIGKQPFFYYNPYQSYGYPVASQMNSPYGYQTDQGITHLNIGTPKRGLKGALQKTVQDNFNNLINTVGAAQDLLY